MDACHEKELPVEVTTHEVQWTTGLRYKSVCHMSKAIMLKDGVPEGQMLPVLLLLINFVCVDFSSLKGMWCVMLP